MSEQSPEKKTVEEETKGESRESIDWVEYNKRTNESWSEYSNNNKSYKEFEEDWDKAFEQMMRRTE